MNFVQARRWAYRCAASLLSIAALGSALVFATSSPGRRGTIDTSDGLIAETIRDVAAVTDSAPEPRTVTTRFTYRAVIPATPAGTQSLDLWLPVPSDGPFQKVTALQVNAPGKFSITREPRYGNRMIYLRRAHPTRAFDVAVTFVVERRPVELMRSGNRSEGEPTGALAAGARSFLTPGRFLLPDRLAPVGGRYHTLAQEAIALLTTARPVAGNGSLALESAQAIFNHTVATMQYDYKHQSPELGRGDVAFVCDYKKGNCSDIHSYVVSLLRSEGIPAYLEFGFPITGVPVSRPIPASGPIPGYHCWTWFQVPGRGWFPLDAADARRWQDAHKPAVRDFLFGNLVTARTAVAVSRGRDLILSPRQKGGPLNYFIYPYAETDGKPFDVSWTLDYHRIDAIAKRN